MSGSVQPPEGGTVELHHRVQMGLLRAVEHQLVCEADPAEAAESVARLLEFTQVHFRAEELLMLHHRYPGLEAHAAEHVHLMGEALAVSQAHGAGDLPQARETVARLRSWIAEHIEGADAAFDRWCARNGITLE